MLDHEQFLFGGEQVAWLWPGRFCRSAGRNFFLLILGWCPVHCAHIWRL
jgi:hypothetical protein